MIEDVLRRSIPLETEMDFSLREGEEIAGWQLQPYADELVALAVVELGYEQVLYGGWAGE